MPRPALMAFVRPFFALVAASFFAFLSVGFAATQGQSVTTDAGGNPYDLSRISTISNADPRRDVEGNIVDAHDGCLQWFHGKYYLYGTRYGNTDGFGQTNRYVCYSSTDLVTWKLEGELFQDAPSGVYYRPYVIYNTKTGKYVLWYNWYPTLWNGQIGVATSDFPQGPFTIQNPDVKLAQASPGDLSLMVDTDGSAYVIYTSISNNHSISVERLKDDYLSSTKQSSGFLGSNSEAPALFKRGDIYYALFDQTCCFGPEGSGAGVYTASNPLGPYTERGNINRDASGIPIIAAQQTFVAQLPTSTGTAYIWMGDRWGSRPDGIKGHDYQFWSSPLEFEADGMIKPLKLDGNIGDKNFVRRKPSSIVIDKAVYGVPSAPQRGQILDLGKEIQQMVNEDKTWFQVGSLIRFKGDPAFGVVKTLTIEYHIDGVATKKAATDPDYIDLAN